MRSTHLSVGSTYTSVQALKLAMHETYSPTYTWLVRRNEPAKGNASGRVNFQCPDASCSFALNARFGVDGATHITTSVPHDCRGAQRDRRRSIEELVSESPTLMGFVPNKQAKHGAEQLRRIADGAAVSLGVTQSHDYLRRISDKSVLDALAQYSYLESLTKQLKTSDPSGLYLFGAVAVDGAALCAGCADRHPDLPAGAGGEPPAAGAGQRVRLAADPARRLGRDGRQGLPRTVLRRPAPFGAVALVDDDR